MIETHRLKNVIFFAISSFVLSRKFTSVYNDLAPKYGNVTVKDFRVICSCDLRRPVCLSTITNLLQTNSEITNVITNQQRFVLVSCGRSTHSNERFFISKNF